MLKIYNMSALPQDSDKRLSIQDIIFATLYSSIVFPGIIGNCIVITIVWKTPSMHTTTNYLLMNLAVADFLTLLFCPGLYDFALTKVHLHGTLGDFICKMFAGNIVVPITINVAAITVCTIAVERYLALVKPFRSNLRLSKASVGYVVAVSWFLGLLSCIPDILTNTYDNTSSNYPCKRPWSLDEYSLNKPFIIFTCVCFGLVCPVVLSICYFEIIRGLYFTRTIFAEISATAEAERQSKKQLALLLVWLTVIFAICSLPFSVYFMVLVFIDPKTVQQKHNILFIFHRICRFVLFSNSFCNPILYALQSSNYRDGFKVICAFRFTCFERFLNNSVRNFTPPNCRRLATTQNGVYLQGEIIELKNIENKQTKSTLMLS